VDSRLSILHETLQLRPARRAQRDPLSREAAVALLLRARDQLELLLIKRAQHEHDPWSGHIALPGGRRSPEDADLVATAYRETEEEVGVALSRFGQYLGALDEVAPQNPRLPPLVIAPFIVTVPANTNAIANPAEVEFAVWVPLPALREPATMDEILIHFEGSRRKLPARRYAGHVIWGLTLRILEQFFSVLDEVGL
jgi:8-oxo-dGTP pyrophosphatase MutT (NUDIX family)